MDFPVHSQRNSDGCLRPRLMQVGDLVIIYERHDSLSYFFLEEGGSITNRFGYFKHEDMIGRPFGSRVYSRNSTGQCGYVYLLEPTPELWGQAMKTRTQIVNDMDCAVVTMMLDVYPGCIVVESGTGSGSMTISLARAVYPTGHVYSYEYNPVRAKIAAEEFKQMKLGDVITVQNRDIYGKSQGAAQDASISTDASVGGFSGVEDHTADAVFLDVPEPWLALHHAKRVLRGGRNLCCYSPCIEQVMKTCEKMRELGFHTIRTIEARQRPFDARVFPLETLDLGLGDEETERKNAHSTRDADARYQTWSQFPSSSNTASSIDAKTASTAEEILKNETGEQQTEKEEDERDEANPSSLKKRKRDENDDGTDLKNNEQNNDEHNSDNNGKRLPFKNPPQTAINGTYAMHIARPLTSMKGHTAFLTFAYAPIPTEPSSTK